MTENILPQIDNEAKAAVNSSLLAYVSSVSHTMLGVVMVVVLPFSA